jgi:hypothetical protein
MMQRLHTIQLSLLSRCLLLSLLATAFASGCTRGKYYLQADREVSTLLAEKSCDPRWALPINYNVRQDERSRFYDAYNQVFPPMPPDDPTSHRYMHCVDGKWGFPRWHVNGDRTTLDNPAWRARIHEVADLTDSGAIVLDERSAMRLAYLNSIDWQDQIETLYLSALDTATERFRFDVQFNGTSGDLNGNQTSYFNRGPLAPAGAATAWTTQTGLTARRRLATAGTAVVGLLNTVVWQFAGPDQTTNVSLLNFSLVQPLLRNAGRSVALETLTIAERALLANLRRLQFYRQGFYLRVVFGGNNPPGLQRRGGFSGGTGFAGFSGTGIGGFGNLGGVFFGGNGVGLNTAGGGSGGAGFAGGGAGNVGGFYGLLQSRQQIRNAEQNLASQERALALLDANLEAGLVGIDQVDQLRQSVETSRAGLLQSKTSLVNQFESYKVSTLNMPSDTAMVLDESFIKRFQFISPEMQLLQNDIGDFLGIYSFGAAQPLKETEDPRKDPLSAGPESITLVPPALEGQPAPLPPPLSGDEEGTSPSIKDIRDQLSRDVVKNALERLDILRARVEEQAGDVLEDLRIVPDVAAARIAGMTPSARESFQRELQLLSDDHQRLLNQINASEDEIEVLMNGVNEANLDLTSDAIVELVSDIAASVDEMSLIQARARVEAINIVPERINPDIAFEIARANRLDWMNNRAGVVDQWRLIQYNAMKLLAGLDVELDGDLRSTGNNPARLRGPAGSMSASLQFDAPLTRLLERNDFRQAIIQYQQVRRQQIAYEDSIKLSLRQSLRQLELSERNLETQRRAVIIAIRRVDQTRLTLMQPADPPPAPSFDGSAPISETAAGQLSPTATLNLIYAFNDLRSSQDALTSIWINYLATRASLAYQLGVMELTDDGMWIDTPLSTAERAAADELPLPPDVPQEWLDHLDEVAPPPPLPQNADVQMLDGEPARLPDVAARALPPVDDDPTGSGAPKPMPTPESGAGVLPASATEEGPKKTWASRIPSFLP